jgi:citrate lyase subunit alpha/citrate CoA-transferase
MLDIGNTGRNEIDLDFNANVVTHSDGYLLHGIGSWQNCLSVKLLFCRFRYSVTGYRNPGQVTTIHGPGELIDVVITEEESP